MSDKGKATDIKRTYDILDGPGDERAEPPAKRVKVYPKQEDVSRDPLFRTGDTAEDFKLIESLSKNVNMDLEKKIAETAAIAPIITDAHLREDREYRHRIQVPTLDQRSFISMEDMTSVICQSERDNTDDIYGDNDLRAANSAFMIMCRELNMRIACTYSDIIEKYGRISENYIGQQSDEGNGKIKGIGSDHFCF